MDVDVDASDGVDGAWRKARVETEERGRHVKWCKVVAFNGS